MRRTLGALLVLVEERLEDRLLLALLQLVVVVDLATAALKDKGDDEEQHDAAKDERHDARASGEEPVEEVAHDDMPFYVWAS